MIRLLLVLSLALLMPLTAAAQRTLIISSQTGRFFYPYQAPEDAVAGADALAARTRELRQAHPDALLLDLGGTLSPRTFTETGYGVSAVAQLVTRMDFDAVHLGATDVVYAGSRSRGLASLPDSDLADTRTFSRLGLKTDSAERELILPATRTLERAGRRTLVAGLADPARASGWIGSSTRLIEKPLDEVLAVSEPGVYRVGISDMDFAVLERIARSSRRPDLLISLAGPQDGTVRAAEGAATIVQGPPFGHLLLVQVSESGSVTATPHRYLSEELVARLNAIPVVELGVGISNVTEALPRALGVDAATIQSDRFDAKPHGDLTRRAFVDPQSVDRSPTVWAFRAVMDNQPVRIYRVQMQLPLGTTSLVPNVSTGWPRIDFLVALRADRTVARVAFRGEARTLGYTIDLEPAVAAVSGIAPPWELPFARYPGVEEYLRAFGVHLERVIELDRRLFPHS